MKKFLLIFAVAILFLSTFAGCKPKLKDVTGVVTEVESSLLGDTVKTLKIYNGEDTLVFSMEDTQYDNGIMLKGDSVDVSYIKGKGDIPKALLVHVKPTPAKVINVETDTTKELLTR